MSPKKLTIFPQKFTIMKISLNYANFVNKIHRNGQQSWVWKNVRVGNVPTPFDLKFSKSGGNKKTTQSKLQIFIEQPLEKIINAQAFFFLWWVWFTRGGWKSEEKVKWVLLHLWKCFFLLNNNFSQFNHAAYHIETRYMIPGFVSELFCLRECTSSI